MKRNQENPQTSKSLSLIPKVWTYLLSAAEPACSINMATNHKSPAKKVRSVQRLLRFIQSKIRTKESTLMIYPQVSVSIEPTGLPKLSVFNLPSVSVPPNPPMNYDQSSQTPQDIDIPRTHPCAPVMPRPSQPICQPIPEIQKYAQHQLIDGDPERERKRQENVQTTLRMIDDALAYSK